MSINLYIIYGNRSLKSLLEWKRSALRQIKVLLPQQNLDSSIESRRVNRLISCSLDRFKGVDPTLFHWDSRLDEIEIKHLDANLNRYLNEEPLEYIEGLAGFYGFEFKVNSSVLIPRFDTELLVELVEQEMSNCLGSPPAILDLGCGSGNLSITLALLSNCKVVGVDRSQEAINVAKTNLDSVPKVSGRVKLIQGDWWGVDFVDYVLGASGANYNLVISNPPYLSNRCYRSAPPSLLYEPQEALIANEDGYADLYRIGSIALELLEENGVLLLEHGSTQQKQLKEYLQDLGYSHVVGYKDLSGLDRCVVAKKK